MTDVPVLVAGADAALVAYLENYAQRRRRSDHGVPFPTAEPNALVGLLVARMAEHVGAGTSADVGQLLDACTAPAFAKDAPPNAMNVAGTTLALASRGARRVATAVRSGGEEGRVRGVVGAAWRYGLLLRAGDERTEAEARRLRSSLLSKAAAMVDGAATGEPLHHASMLAFVLGSIEDEELTDAGRRLVGSVAAERRDDGELPVAAGSSDLALSAHVAAFVAAAAVCDEAAVGMQVAEVLLTRRLDADRGLLRSSADEDRYETSPWVPLALLSCTPGPEAVTDALGAVLSRRLEAPDDETPETRRRGLLPPPEAAISAYLDNYANRQSGARDGLVFPAPEPNAMLALLFLRLGQVLRPPVVKAYADHQIGLLTRPALEPDAGSNVTNLAGYVLAEAAATLPDADPREEDVLRCLDLGVEAVTGAIGEAWRCLLILRAAPSVRERCALDLDGELERRRETLLKRAQTMVDAAQAGEKLQHASMLAVPLALLGQAAGDAKLSSAAKDLVTAVAAFQRDDGSVPQDLTGSEQALTAHLGAFVLAAELTGTRESARRGHDHLIATRLDPERGLLRQSDVDDGKFELAPWVPLSLVPFLTRLRFMAQALDPPAQDLPDYEIADVRADEDAIVYELTTPEGPVERRYDAGDLNGLLAGVLAQLAPLEPGDLSPRLASHVLIGLFSVLEVAADDGTREDLEAAARKILDEVLDAQQPSGGWQFARRNVPSVVYTAGGKRETEFPDLQYTIDASVPGIALCLAHQHFDDPRLRPAAERAFDFFEEHVGRVDWEGKPVWLLYPDDEKTPKQGTAVNYEVWAGSFFAGLSRITEDPARRARALAYIEDILDYTEKHLHPNGDIAYGDYVTELRTPYASWDAFLLAEIAEQTGNERARDMAERVLHRLAEVIQPQGVLPNVVDFFQELGPHRRWTTHRHGIGPYPIRTYYQLYYVGACALAGVEPRAALAAFGFVLNETFEPVHVGMSTGFVSDGKYDVRPDGLSRVGRDWLLMAVAAVGRLSGSTYVPSSRVLLGPEERFARELGALHDHVTRARAQAGDDPGLTADLGRGCLAVWRATGEDRWRSRFDDAVRDLLARQNEDGSWSGPDDEPWNLIDRKRRQAEPAPRIETTAAVARFLREAASEAAGAAAASDRAVTWLSALPVGPDLLLDDGAERSEPLAAHAMATGVLLSVGAPAGRTALEALTVRLDEDGLWPAGDGDRSRGRIQGVVLDALAGLDEAAAVVREGADAAWEHLFTAALGRGQRAAGERDPMDAGSAALHARVLLAHGGGDEREREGRGHLALRFLLHTYRDGTGALIVARSEATHDPLLAGPQTGSAGRGDLRSARNAALAFRGLASCFEHAPGAGDFFPR